jgi:hypothetical protein
MNLLKASCLPLALAALAACGPRPGPSASAGDSLAIDSLYQTFRVAYASLNDSLVTALYHPDAVYGAGGAPGFTIGRDSIAPGFQRFFQSVREQGATLELRFRFVRRHRHDRIASDAGYYWLRRRWADSVAKPSIGKFVTVMTRDSMGRWGFATDTYSDATQAAFDAAPPFEP